MINTFSLLINVIELSNYSWIYCRTVRNNYVSLSLWHWHICPVGICKYVKTCSEYESQMEQCIHFAETLLFSVANYLFICQLSLAIENWNNANDRTEFEFQEKKTVVRKKIIWISCTFRRSVAFGVMFKRKKMVLILWSRKNRDFCNFIFCKIHN